jgi:hypothetical protein
MHQFTHAWLAFMAIKRLEAKNPGLKQDEQPYATSLIEWFRKNRDCVIQGAWYPDLIIKDNGTSHILKIKPYDETDKTRKKVNVVPPSGFKSLPDEYSGYTKWGKNSPLRAQSFTVDETTNLPDRCESFTETVIDHLKIQWHEEKGSPVSPTSNQLAHLLFMQSHYIADAHVPMHCDNRPFSDGTNLHAKVEDLWEKEVKDNFKIDDSDSKNIRFFYDEKGYPSKKDEQKFSNSYLNDVEKVMGTRPFGPIDSLFKSSNNNVWDFMSSVCQNSYLLAYHFFDPAKIPAPKQKTLQEWINDNHTELNDFHIAVLADAADSIARVWLRLWRRYEDWRTDRVKEAEKEKKKKEATENRQPPTG